MKADTAVLSRRSFLSGKFSRPAVELQPPGALPQPLFEPVRARCDADTPAWPPKASIAASCLAQLGVVCRSCGDACDESAIRFRPRLRGAPQPELETTRCTGCGACVSVCPVGAMQIIHPQDVSRS